MKNYELRITSLLAPPQRTREVLDATRCEYLCTNNKRHFECKTNQFPNHVVSNSELRSIKSRSVKLRSIKS
jgi:hypothetical protein